MLSEGSLGKVGVWRGKFRDGWCWGREVQGRLLLSEGSLGKVGAERGKFREGWWSAREV